MTDILIHDMEVPKHCIDCPCMVDKYGGDNCCLQSEEANEKIESWDDMKAGCPLIELPEHGDLVERERVINLINSILEQTYDPEAVHRLRWLRDCARTMANFALLPRQEETNERL